MAALGGMFGPMENLPEAFAQVGAWLPFGAAAETFQSTVALLLFRWERTEPASTVPPAEWSMGTVHRPAGDRHEVLRVMGTGLRPASPRGGLSGPRRVRGPHGRAISA